MSRIGKQLITIPNGVTVNTDSGVLTVKGPGGELIRVLNPVVAVVVEEGTVRLQVKNPEEKSGSSSPDEIGNSLDVSIQCQYFVRLERHSKW